MREMVEAKAFPPSFDVARRRRIFDFIRTTGLNVLFGSLWWVDESIWKTQADHYDQQSTRKAHPGLSLRKQPLETPYETVPMLNGTSRPANGAFAVKHCSAERTDEQPTWFGTLRPVQADLAWWARGIHQNMFKPSLDEEEKKALEQWLVERMPV